jgi:broad specificity phosphatase PhoE
MKIFIIRHGESTSDIENRYGGDYDDHLTDRGLEQVEELAKKLEGKEIEMIFSSPRLRAKETAEILENKLECQLQIIYDLCERNAYGILTGMKKEEAKSKHLEQVNLLGRYDSCVDGAEPYEELLQRVKKVFEDVINSSFETVAIVSHGGFLRCFFRDVLKWGELKEIGDCSYMELIKNGPEYEIKSADGITLENF